jgi:hypothetical protein
VKGAAAVSPRATVRLLLTCTNQCMFCGQDGVLDAPVNVRVALETARASHDAVTFVGGEPTLDPKLEQHVQAARSLGFQRIGLQTNGSQMADAAFTATLARAGLTDVHLSLHGADAPVHDYHTGRPGSFDDVLGAIDAARTNKLGVVVTTVLTRSNFRVLGALPSLLAARGVLGLCISVPWNAGRAAVASDRVVQRLALALPFALHALSAAHALRLPAWISGAPLCLLGPLALHSLPGGQRSYVSACESCAARSLCPGVDAAYLARFGADELTARDAPPAAPVADDEIAAMFVGAGELAPTAEPARAVISRPRTSLPMVGKVKPALAEATAGAERRTGEALREILPALFEPAPLEGESKG